MITLAIFDMAGTTVDEDNVVYKTVHQVLTQAGYPLEFKTVLTIAAGKEKSQAIGDAIAHLTGQAAPEEEVKTIHRHFKEMLREAYRSHTASPMPFAEDLFEHLQQADIRVVLNTGYDRPTADTLLTQLGWNDSALIDLTLTADDVSQGRPHPDMIQRAMQHFGINDSQRVAKTGDSIVDVEEGRNAGCGVVVGITTGAHTAEQLQSARPTHIIDSLREFMPGIQ
jgi:phosphonatase-like hydrolase